MGSFPMSIANNFCDKLLPKYLVSKTVLIYCPHPVKYNMFLHILLMYAYCMVSSVRHFKTTLFFNQGCMDYEGCCRQ
jgi:hypothetical protein